MARPTGAKDERPWAAALRKALAKRDGKTGPQHLERVASACVAAAIDGDIPAIKEIGDRLDGKAPQGITLAGDPDKPLKQVIEHTFKSAI